MLAALAEDLRSTDWLSDATALEDPASWSSLAMARESSPDAQAIDDRQLIVVIRLGGVSPLVRLAKQCRIVRL